MKIGIYLKNDCKSDAVDEFISELDRYSIEHFIVGKSSDVPDYYVVFGGDGTILSAAEIAINAGIPLITVNMGTVGFLSAYEPNAVKLLAENIYAGAVVFSTRSVLEISYREKKYLALNDAVIERDKTYSGHSVISKIMLKIDGKTVYELSSDGVIIATPTGSTAYSLSAGGVILTPELKSFIATPICSHSLSSRPIVYGDDVEAEIDVLPGGADCIFSCDGKPVEKVSGGERVTVRKSDKTLIISDTKKDFFDKIKQKLG